MKLIEHEKENIVWGLMDRISRTELVDLLINGMKDSPGQWSPLGVWDETLGDMTGFNITKERDMIAIRFDGTLSYVRKSKKEDKRVTKTLDVSEEDKKRLKESLEYLINDKIFNIMSENV